MIIQNMIIVVEMDQSMLKEKKLGNEFWTKVVHTTTYTLNKCPTRAFLDLTP
jgi:hypothetical protein